MKNKKGFTLIELLVVIAIISLLSSIVFASVSSARTKAEITKTVTQGKELEKAVELARLSTGTYPISTDHTISIKESLVDEIDEYISSIDEVVDISTSVIGVKTEEDVVYVSNGQYATNTYTFLKCGYDGEIDPYITFFQSTEDLSGRSDIDYLYQNYTPYGNAPSFPIGDNPIPTTGENVFSSPSDISPETWSRVQIGGASMMCMCTAGETCNDCGSTTDTVYYYCTK